VILLGSLVGIFFGSSTLFFILSPYTPVEFQQQFFRSLRSFWVFTLITLDYKLSLHGMEYGTPVYRATRSKVHQRAAERMLWLANANKGIFIKAGQHIASLTHLLPPQYTDTLCVLQDKAPYVTFNDVVGVFLFEFGKRPDDIFESFERSPIASASLAQVHRAKLATTEGIKDVAVKIQYPGLIEKFSGDVKTFQLIAKCVSWAFPDFQFGWLVDEFRQSVAMELDFMNEARNAEQIGRNFSWHKQFAVPKIYWAWTKKRILTMEFIDGIKITDTKSLEAAGFRLRDVASQLVDLFSEQVFVHGFVHSDPHPGNILVRRAPHSKKTIPQIVLLDHGLYRKLDEEVRLNYCKLWKALVTGNAADVEIYGRKLGAGDYTRYLAMMLTFRPSIGRLDQVTKMEREDIRKLAVEIWEKGGAMEDISSLLESLPRDLLLVLRNNDLIMSINKELGFPVNRFLIAARAAIRGVIISEGTKPTLLERIKCEYRLFVFNARLKFVGVVLKLYKTYRGLVSGNGNAEVVI